MKRMIFIILAMMMCVVAKGQLTRYINYMEKQKDCVAETYRIVPVAISFTHFEDDNVLINEALYCINWYNEKSNDKIELDSLKFEYPFFLYAYNKNECVAKLMLVHCQNIGVQSSCALDKMKNVPLYIMKIKLPNGKYSGKREDLFCQTFLIIPTGVNMLPFYCGVFLSDDFYKDFIGQMDYDGCGVNYLLKKLSDSKSLR